MYDQQVITNIKEILIAREESIAVAESVTAGSLQLALSSAENASVFFQGGITAYNIGQKARHLHVDPIHAQSCNSVSAKIAETLALNVILLFNSDWGVGITGYAAPVPELNIRDLFVFYCIAFGDKCVITKKLECQEKSPQQAQLYYTNYLLKDFANYLLNHSKR
jgi:nicotinamide-nucleotide amidase